MIFRFYRHARRHYTYDTYEALLVQQLAEERANVKRVLLIIY